MVGVLRMGLAGDRESVGVVVRSMLAGLHSVLLSMLAAVRVPVGDSQGHADGAAGGTSHPSPLKTTRTSAQKTYMGGHVDCGLGVTRSLYCAGRSRSKDCRHTVPFTRRPYGGFGMGVCMARAPPHNRRPKLGPAEGMNESLCNVTRADSTPERPALSPRQSGVWKALTMQMCNHVSGHGAWALATRFAYFIAIWCNDGSWGRIRRAGVKSTC